MNIIMLIMGMLIRLLVRGCIKEIVPYIRRDFRAYFRRIQVQHRLQRPDRNSERVINNTERRINDIEYRIEFQPSPTQPQVEIELVQMSLVGGAPAGFENVAPMAMGLAQLDHDADFTVDSFFDIFYQVSGYAGLDDGNTVPIQIVALDLVSAGNGFDVHLQGAIGPGSRGGAPPNVVSLIFMNDLRGYARNAPPPPCVGDLNGDGFTNVFDFAIFAGNFGMTVPPNTGGDLDGNGTVNVFDFAIFAADFGCAP